MKIVTIEEHYVSEAINHQYNQLMNQTATEEEKIKAKFIEDYIKKDKRITDLGPERIAYMDQVGIDVQLISYGNNSPMDLPAEHAIPLSKQANDDLAKACQQYPYRFYGLATLPVADPKAAADELERTVKELNFKGVMLQGSYNGQFFDDQAFWPIFEKAQALDVPIQLHPGEVDAKVIDHYYEGNWSPQVTMTLSGHGLGWHYDAGIHVLRLILAGVFDAYPNLKIISGHWGETIPYFLDRLNETLPQAVTGLKHDIAYYYRHNIYVTPSGMFYKAPMSLCINELGADRVLWSMDYPYMLRENTATFLENFDISDEEKAQIAYKNAEALFKL